MLLPEKFLFQNDNPFISDLHLLQMETLFANDVEFFSIWIYTYFSKLLNPYTRIMRHFSLSLFVAFIFLAIIQIIGDAGIGENECRATGKKNRLNLLTLFVSNWMEETLKSSHILGFLIQYFFLVAFSLMTAMSLETWQQIS